MNKIINRIIDFIRRGKQCKNSFQLPVFAFVMLFFAGVLGGCSASSYAHRVYETDGSGTEQISDDVMDTERISDTNDVSGTEGISDTNNVSGAEGISDTDNVSGAKNVSDTSDASGADNISNTADASDSDKGEARTVVVYVCGAVCTPGVYELPEGSRVVHAIEAAGGLLEEADSNAVNQAGLISDGEQIRIWTKEEGEAFALNSGGFGSESQTVGAANPGEEKVNINRASVSELMELPGIGQSKADAIVAYRKEHGNFQCIEDIMKISGIKETVFSQIKDLIAV